MCKRCVILHEVLCDYLQTLIFEGIMKLTPVDCEGLHIKWRDLPKYVTEIRHVPKSLDCELVCFDPYHPQIFIHGAQL